MAEDDRLPLPPVLVEDLDSVAGADRGHRTSLLGLRTGEGSHPASSVDSPMWAPAAVGEADFQETTYWRELKLAVTGRPARCPAEKELGWHRSRSGKRSRSS